MSKLFKNIGFLTVSQAANYVLPLITIPYITRVVGPENYGLIEFATVAMLYFSAIVIYGFKTTATRKIAENPDDMNHVSRVFTTVVYTRLLLFIISAIAFAICLAIIPKFKEETTLMLAAFPIVLGWALYPDFLFQGLQKLQFVAFANFAIKAIAAVLIFVLLQSPEDFYYVLGINAAAQLLVGVGVLLLSFKAVAGLRLTGFSTSKIKDQLKEGSYIFLSHFFTRIYTFSSILFLGFLLTDKEMGLFAAGLKLVIVAQSFLFLPLSGALFPFLTKLFKDNKEDYFVQFKRALLVMLGVAIVSSGILILVPDFFVHLIFGEKYLEASPFLQIMAPLLIFTTISHFTMQQGLIIFKKDRIYLLIIVVVGLVSLLLNFTMIKPFGLYGAAWVKVGVDGFLAFLGSICFWKAWYRIKLTK